MSEIRNKERGRIGVIGLLTILFIGLKLMGHISWSWWWVLSPIIITFALIFIIFFFVAIFGD